MSEPRGGRFLSCQRWFNISFAVLSEQGQCTQWCTTKCKHRAPWPPNPSPPSSKWKKKKLMASLSGFLLRRALNCTLCHGGWRADVNTAFNYKSNPKRASHRCPRAPGTKALHTQTPHNALLGTSGYSPPWVHIWDRNVFSGGAMQRMSYSSGALCSDPVLLWKETPDLRAELLEFVITCFYIISSNIHIKEDFVYF